MSQIKCEFIPKLPKEFQEVITQKPHLHRYLHIIGEKAIPIPLWLTKLKRDMAREVSNVIYPVSNDVFIHILKKVGGRAEYNIIEPISNYNYLPLLNLIEELMAYKIGVQHEYVNLSQKREILIKLLDEIIFVDPTIKDLNEYKIVGKETRRRLYVSEDAKSSLIYVMIRDKVGIGPLEPMILDPYIEDISCDGLGPVFVEHKVFGSCVSNLVFNNQEELEDYVKRISERIGRPVSLRKPIIDGTLPDGSRLNIVFGSDISQRGTNFTIRKFSKIPLSITQLCLWNTLDYLSAAYLWMLIENGMSVWVAGETASGKTTTLNALCTFIKPEAKIVTVEDTPEVIVPHENWVREVTKEGEDSEFKIDLFELLKAALRQRPNYIIVGEIRGREGYVAFQAMQTGHPVMSTFHASSVQKLIQRITGTPIEVPKPYVDNINAVVIQSAVRVPKLRKVERRVISINEIVGYNSAEDSFNYTELISWDPVTDTFIFKGEDSSYLLEKIALFHGYRRKDVKNIWLELTKRANLLKMLAENGLTDYFDVWNTLKVVRDLGIDRALELMKKGALLAGIRG